MFSVSAKVIDGVSGTVMNAPDGTIVVFTVEAGATADLALSTCDNGTAAGQCTIVVNSTVPGTYTVTVTSLTFLPGNGVIDVPVNSPISLTVDEQSSADKTFRQYRITTEDDATNLAGVDHVFTFTVEYTENGTTWQALAGSTVQFAADDPSAIADIQAPGVGVLTCITDALGQCDVTVSSAVPGSVTVSVVSITDTLPTGLPDPATDAFTLPVTDTTAVLSTDEATKTWISFAADVQATATNLAGDPHTFTITATVDDGSGPAPVPDGSVVNYTWTGDGTAEPASSCTIAVGSCTVVVSSASAGSGVIELTSIDATVNLTAFDGAPISASVDGSLTATKTWIAFDVDISRSAVNPIGQPHQFIIQTRVDLGDGNGLVPVGGTVTYTWTGDNPESPLGSCTTDAVTGRCTVTVTSATPGEGTLTATLLETDDWTIDLEAVGLGQSEQLTIPVEATKTWVAYRASVTPNATNLVGDPHTFDVLVEQTENGLDWVAVPDGTTLTWTLTGPGTLVDAGTTCDDGTVEGACTIEINSVVHGVSTVTIDAITSTIIDGEPVTGSIVVASDTGIKTWIDFQADVQSSATNLAGDPHTFTITATVDFGAGAVPVPDGSVVHYTWTGDGTAAPVSSCTIAGGTCTVVVSSADAGSGEIELTSLDATVNDTDFEGAPVSAAAESGSLTATKTWIDFDLTVGPSAVNLIGEPHTFTITATVDDGTGDVAVPDGSTVNFTWSGPEPASPASSCTTTGGSCTVTVNSSAPGSGTITLTSITATVDGTTFTGVAASVATGGSLTATKQWIFPPNADLAIREERECHDGRAGRHVQLDPRRCEQRSWTGDQHAGRRHGPGAIQRHGCQWSGRVDVLERRERGQLHEGVRCSRRNRAVHHLRVNPSRRAGRHGHQHRHGERGDAGYEPGQQLGHRVRADPRSGQPAAGGIAPNRFGRRRDAPADRCGAARRRLRCVGNQSATYRPRRLLIEPPRHDGAPRTGAPSDSSAELPAPPNLSGS